jgi:adenylosuccinate synthase
MGLDRLEYLNKGVTDRAKLTDGTRQFLHELEMDTGVPIQFAGTGFGTFEVITTPIIAPHAQLAHA